MFYKALQKKKNNKKAFTLIELIVVIAIIGVLIAILVPTMNGFVTTARTQTANANARTVYSIAQAEVTLAMTQNTTIVASYTKASSDAVGKAILAQLGTLAATATYTITVTVATGTVTAVTYTDTANNLTGAYPPAALPS